MKEREKKSTVFHSAIICIFVFRLKEGSWQSSWNCMTLCMIRPWPGSLHLKMIWRVKSSATLGSCLPKTLTHRWMFAPNQSHICSKCSFIVILPPACLLCNIPMYNSHFYIPVVCIYNLIHLIWLIDTFDNTFDSGFVFPSGTPVVLRGVGGCWLCFLWKTKPSWPSSPWPLLRTGWLPFAGSSFL